MPLTTDELEQILISAIVSANFAKPEAAPSFAAVLAAPVTEAVNELIESTSQLSAPATTAAPLMTVVDAIGLRNLISATISEITPDDEQSVDRIAEKLLLAGLIDVPALLHSAHGGPATGLIQTIPAASTGSHAAVAPALSVPSSILNPSPAPLA